MSDSILDYEHVPVVEVDVPEYTSEQKAEAQNKRPPERFFIPGKSKPLASAGLTIIIAAIEVPHIMPEEDVSAMRLQIQAMGAKEVQLVKTIKTKDIPGYGSRICISAREEMSPLPVVIPDEGEVEVEELEAEELEQSKVSNG